MRADFLDPPPLPEWLAADLPFRRRIFDGPTHKIHFIDEGQGPTVVLQHGNPVWCYLWRKVILLLVNEGMRVVVPDLIGLGLSDKPTDPTVHTLEFHGRRISELIRALELNSITVVGQDWGGPIVAYAAALNPERIHGAVFANTSLAMPRKPPRATMFHRFSNLPLLPGLLFRQFNFPIPILHRVQGDPGSIGAREKRAYTYPLRAKRDRTAPLALARMVPTTLQHPTVQALEKVDAWARSFRGPSELVWGMKDPILGKAIYKTKELFPDARVTETSAGHFLQEEVPEELAAAIVRVVSNRSPQ